MRNAVLAAAAVVLLGWSAVLIYSYNGFAVVTLAGALACGLMIFRHIWLPLLALVAASICALGTWATLDGGANSLTAVPWAVAGTLLLATSAALFRRRWCGGRTA